MVRCQTSFYHLVMVLYVEMVWSSCWLLYGYYRCLRLSYLTAMNDFDDTKSQNDILPFSVAIYISNIYLCYIWQFLGTIFTLDFLGTKGIIIISTICPSVCPSIHPSTSFSLNRSTVFMCWFQSWCHHSIDHGPATKILVVPISHWLLCHIRVVSCLRANHFLKWYFMIMMYLNMNLLVSAHKKHYFFEHQIFLSTTYHTKSTQNFNCAVIFYCIFFVDNHIIHQYLEYKFIDIYWYIKYIKFL